jgi:hypothetical protein
MDKKRISGFAGSWWAFETFTEECEAESNASALWQKINELELCKSESYDCFLPIAHINHADPFYTLRDHRLTEEYRSEANKKIRPFPWK